MNLKTVFIANRWENQLWQKLACEIDTKVEFKVACECMKIEDRTRERTNQYVDVFLAIL